jgi:hypothetical protein
VIYFFAAVSAIVTGGLFVVAARMFGIEQNGILIACAIIGAGMQVVLLMVWYLLRTRPGKGDTRAE